MNKSEIIKELRETLLKDHIELRGQMYAVQVALRAIIKNHPDREIFSRNISVELENWVSSWLNTEVPDAILDGFQKAREVILPAD